MEIGLAALLLGMLLLTGPVASILLRIASILLPVAFLAALVAFAAFRIQSAASHGASRAG